MRTSATVCVLLLLAAPSPTGGYSPSSPLRNAGQQEAFAAGITRSVRANRYWSGPLRSVAVDSSDASDAVVAVDAAGEPEDGSPYASNGVVAVHSRACAFVKRRILHPFLVAFHSKDVGVERATGSNFTALFDGGASIGGFGSSNEGPVAVEAASNDASNDVEAAGANELPSAFAADADVGMGERWAIASPSVDLSGRWRPEVTQEFKHQYHMYMKNCSSPALLRQVILSALGRVEDTIVHKARELTMVSKSPAGTWMRTLVSSGGDGEEPVRVEIKDPDRDRVTVESWWERGGTVHRSFLTGKPKLGGGVFETLRYLEDDDTLVTESFFHPAGAVGAMAAAARNSTFALSSSSSSSLPASSTAASKFKPGYVKWRYRRVG